MHDPKGIHVVNSLLVWQIPRTGEERLSWLFKNAERFKTAFSIRFGPIASSVNLCHPCNVKKLLRTSAPKQTSDGAGYTLLRPWLGTTTVTENIAF